MKTKNNKPKISAKPKQNLAKPRKYLTIGQKQQIIEIWKSGQETAEQLAKKFDSSLSAIYRIIGLKEDLSGRDSNRKYLRGQPHHDSKEILTDLIALKTENNKPKISAKPKQKLTKPRKHLTIGQKQQIIELWKSGQQQKKKITNLESVRNLNKN